MIQIRIKNNRPSCTSISSKEFRIRFVLNVVFKAHFVMWKYEDEGWWDPRGLSG